MTQPQPPALATPPPAPMLDDMADIRRAVAHQRRCRYSGKRLCHTSTVLVKIIRNGHIDTVALHRDAWPQRRPLVEQHFGPDNVHAIDGRALFTQ